MRIVNIIQRYPPAVGGSETWCQEVCRYLARRGHEVKVLTLDVNREEEFWREPSDSSHMLAFGRLEFDEGVIVRRYHRSLPIHCVHHLFFKNILDKLLKIYFYGPHSSEMYGSMWREIKRADVVFLHTLPYPHNYIAFALAKLFRKKVVVVPHFHPSHPHYESWSNYLLLKHCDVVVTVTEFEKRYLSAKGVDTNKLFVTGNAIHPEDYRPQNLDAFKARLRVEHNLMPEDKVIIFIGRKTEEKGVWHLIEAVKGLINEMPIKLFLVGPKLDWYEKQYAELSEVEKERIIDLGVVPHQEKVNLLHLSDLMVLPSRYEAFGIVFLEAWVCGVPVLGTDEGAVPSVIEDNGFLCKFGKVEDLKDKLRAAFSDETSLKAMGARGRTMVYEKYTWDVIGMKARKAVEEAHHTGRRRQKKIVIVVNAYPPNFIGGAELIAHSHAKSLKSMGHEVIIFAGERNNEGRRHSLRKDSYEGLVVYRVCLHQQDYSYDHFNIYHERVHDLFNNLIEKFCPDVVHFQNLVGLGASLIRAAKQRGIKTVLTLHDYQGFCLKNTLVRNDDSVCKDYSRCAECFPVISGQRWKGVPVQMRSDFLARQMKEVDVFISPSNYVAKTYVNSGINEDKIKVIRNGLDVQRFSTIKKVKEKHKVRFSYIGYLGPHKGLPTIIEALKHFRDQQRVFVNIVGVGDQKSLYEQQVRELGWEHSVKFWGQVANENITDVFRETDVLILPSVWPENQPVSIMEAMASRIPVIASSIGGIPELVEHGQTGYLFEAGNAKELSEKMSEFLADSSKIIEFGERAFRKIMTFGSPVEKIIEVYNGEQAASKALKSREPLVVCVGKNMRPDCSFIINTLMKQIGSKCRFLMLDWLEKSQIKEAALVWLTDQQPKMEDALTAVRSGLPLLVPAEHKLLRDLVVFGKCGLFYEDVSEAVECLNFIVENDPIRIAMGQNSHKLLYDKSN